MTKEIIFIKKSSDEDYKKAKLKNLRKKLIEKIEQRDFLIFHEIPSVHMEYMLILGRLEIQVYELDVERLRLKIKSELLQAFINRQEKINEEEIEKTLIQEFKSYQEKIKVLFKEMEEAKKTFSKGTLDVEDSKNIKKLYRELIKKLHPDLNPNQSEQEKIYYQQAVEAYESGDLKTIQTLIVLTGDFGQGEKLDNYEEEKNHLLSLIEEVEKEIQALEHQFPLTERKLVGNEEELAVRKENLLNEIDLLKLAIERLQDKIRRQYQQNEE